MPVNLTLILMMFSSNLRLISLRHSLLLQVLVASKVLLELLASTWDLWWLPLLVSPPFSRHVALHDDQVTILCWWKSWCFSQAKSARGASLEFSTILTNCYFDGGKALSPILSPSSTTTLALLKYFNLRHGLVKEIHYVDGLMQVDWLVPFYRRAWLHLMCTNCEL